MAYVREKKYARANKGLHYIHAFLGHQMNHFIINIRIELYGTKIQNIHHKT